jgi:hypothetical protein
MILSLDEIEPTKMIDVAARNTKSSFTCYIFVSFSFFIHAHDNVCFALFSKYCVKAIFHGFGAADPALRTERPRRAERLSRQFGGGGKGVCPSGSASSLRQAAILFAVERKPPHGIFNWTSGRGEGQERERVSAILLSCARQRPRSGST